jgi:hypothetical protein
MLLSRNCVLATSEAYKARSDNRVAALTNTIFFIYSPHKVKHMIFYFVAIMSRGRGGNMHALSVVDGEVWLTKSQHCDALTLCFFRMFFSLIIL